MDRVVVCTEADIDMISKQINQDLKDANENFKEGIGKIMAYIHKTDGPLSDDDVSHVYKSLDLLIR